MTSWDTDSKKPQETYEGGRSYLNCVSEYLTGETCEGQAKNDMGECRMVSKLFYGVLPPLPIYRFCRPVRLVTRSPFCCCLPDCNEDLSTLQLQAVVPKAIFLSDH